MCCCLWVSTRCHVDVHEEKRRVLHINWQKIVIKFTGYTDNAKVQQQLDNMEIKHVLRASLVGLEEIKLDVIEAHQLV